MALRQALPLVHAVSTILGGKADPALLDAAAPTEEEGVAAAEAAQSWGPSPTVDDLRPEVT